MAARRYSGWLSTASVFSSSIVRRGSSADQGGVCGCAHNPPRALAHLLVRHGEFVSRAELQRAIWPDGTFVHFDYGLNSCMKQIRAALADNPSAPTYIETLVRRGFRFIAPVSVGDVSFSSGPELSVVARPGAVVEHRRKAESL